MRCRPAPACSRANRLCARSQPHHAVYTPYPCPRLLATATLPLCYTQLYVRDPYHSLVPRVVISPWFLRLITKWCMVRAGLSSNILNPIETLANPSRKIRNVLRGQVRQLFGRLRGTALPDTLRRPAHPQVENELFICPASRVPDSLSYLVAAATKAEPSTPILMLQIPATPRLLLVLPGDLQAFRRDEPRALQLSSVQCPRSCRPRGRRIIPHSEAAFSYAHDRIPGACSPRCSPGFLTPNAFFVRIGALPHPDMAHQTHFKWPLSYSAHAWLKVFRLLSPGPYSRKQSVRLLADVRLGSDFCWSQALARHLIIDFESPLAGGPRPHRHQVFIHAV
ncbi:hypothetical protein BC834DRAFT_672444 [Gloeopeniophorella convolvens]|nr:hypothetical protein BC834DRAFT_672444 [Gloeopeniophorella convolvens]